MTLRTTTLLLATLCMAGFGVAHAQIITPSYVTVNLSSSPNANDFPYGITCDDPSYYYMTISSQGALARIDKATSAVTLFDNNAVGAGEDWYSVARDPVSGKLYINERDNGKMRIFNPATGTFGVLPVIDTATLSGLGITYSEAANTMTFGADTVNLGFTSFGENRYAGGYIWQVLDYEYDLGALFPGSGFGTFIFHGLVKIDPATDTIVSRHPISGAQALRGTSVDAAVPTILWITDYGAEKIYRFDTLTGLVTDTIDAAGTRPQGIANDLTRIYVAMNQNSTAVTSKILQVDKVGFASSTIDTGAAITTGGTFTVFVMGNDILFTDQSAHTGRFDKTNPAGTMSIVSTQGTTSSNHFGCISGTNWVWAGQGSAVMGSVPVSSFGSLTESSSRGSGCAGDCYPPHFGVDKYGRVFYDDGLEVNGKAYMMDNVLHVHNRQIIEVPVGKPATFTVKIQDTNPEQIRMCELGLGIEKGHFVLNDATVLITHLIGFDGTTQTTVAGDASAVRNVSVQSEAADGKLYCTFRLTPTKHLGHDMFGIQAMDQYRYNKITFVNEGFTAKGTSLVGTPVYSVIDRDGTVHDIAILDQTLEDMTKAVDIEGNIWNLAGGHWKKQYMRPDNKGTLSQYHGFERNDPEFALMKRGQELLAMQYFDSSLIQAELPEPFSYPVTSYGRLHDPIPNMNKAQIEYARSQAQ